MCRAFIVSIISLFFVSCSLSGEIDPVIVSVGDQSLHYSSLCSILPINYSKEDSAVIVDDYIRSWVYQQVILQKAHLNLSDEEKDIESAIDAYRISLLVERYQNKILSQKFSPNISESEVYRYYESMKDNFRLNEVIVKCVFAVVPKVSPDIDKFGSYLEFKSDADYAEVENYLVTYSHNYVLSLDHWVTFSSIKRYLPLSSDINGYLLTKKIFRDSDENNDYFLWVSEARLPDEIAPVEYVSEKIRSILINKKKITFLKKLNTELYEEALHNNSIKYYTDESK